MKTLCFIGIIFEEKLENEIVEIKKTIKERFNCKHSLKTKPHITLYEPISVEDVSEFWEKSIKDINDFGSFQIVINNFNHFDDRVLYIDVEKNEKLENLYESVRGKSSLNYKPHITMAHRDIKNFEDLWNCYKNQKIEKNTKVEYLVLFAHDSKQWRIEKRLKL